MKDLTALMAQQALFNLDVKSTMCAFHESVLSMVTPRNLVLLTLVIMVLETTIFIFISFCFLVINCKRWVLLQFDVNRLLWNQLIVSFITEIIIFLNSCESILEIIIESSANNIGLATLLRVQERSFM